MTHPLTLRAPWYVLERGPVLMTDPVARRPALQKYDQPDFVRQLIADPRQSLKFHVHEDVWSFPVPLGAFPRPGKGRERFATSRLVHTPMRKLYQPSHDRFYAVAVELFCDEPGLPRPGELTGVDLRFVVRRERFVVKGDWKVACRLARDLAVELDKEKKPSDAVKDVPETDDVDDVLWVERTEERAFSATQLTQLAAVKAHRIVEAWTVDAAGRGRWTEIPEEATPALAPGEQTLPMWRLPPRPEDCAPARTRSLWFGIVPTFSGEVDANTARPKLDDRSIYRVRCFARQQPGPGREGCPPRLWWSDPTAAYRLASFYDPQGTKNRRVSITMPDFRTLAARAGQDQGPGGVEIVQPPGSQLKFDPDNGTPGNADRQDFGDATSRCTFALELLMIVAMFLFTLFLPVVVFLFQLWWLLLLRFCFPRPDLAIEVLGAHFTAGKTIKDLPDRPTPPAMPPKRPADLQMLDDLLEARGAAGRIVVDAAGFAGDKDLGAALVEGLDPKSAAKTPVRTPETVTEDPLCDGAPARVRGP
jgi:hypothetical protein